MQFEFPIKYPIEQIRIMNFFLRLQSPVQGPIQVRAFFNSPDGVELQPIFLHGTGNEILSPFSGFVPFSIAVKPERAAEKCILVLQPVDEQMHFTCTVYAVLVNNQVDGVQFPSSEQQSYTYPGGDLQEEPDEESLFPFQMIENVQVVDPVVEDANQVQFVLDSAQTDEYVLLHQSLKEQEVYSETESVLFLPKNHYLPKEPIVATYRNLFPKAKLGGGTVDIMFYLDTDRPGIDKSREYFTLMFKEYNKGRAGAISFPSEGARHYTDYLPGNYSAHLMYGYQDICAPRKYTVSQDHQTDELNAPLPGTMFFIKTQNLPKYLRIYTEHPEGLSVWRFRCASEKIAPFEQCLYHMADISEHIETIKMCSNVAASVRKAVLYQFFQTAFVRKKIDAARYTKGNIPDALCRKMILFIEDNLCNHINIKMLMDEFHCSESFLSHYFTKNMHMSFSSYVSQAKVTRSKQWLIAGGKTISEIAELLDYSDVQAFSHAFKRVEGMSPTAFRRMHAASDKV